ncbi:MAG: hypothetical protein ACYCUF_04325 [Acidimicrobiales bacterium]|jgi:hypothetical protein|nr:hypothetical protein [Actinomycetota bacterium]MDA8355697.1 hypothetical protein [Actinomycetota bacterium]
MHTPRRTAKRGRRRLKGAKLASLARLAGNAAFTSATVTRYGTTATVSVALICCLWYGVFGRLAVQVALVRDKSKTAYDVALVTTDLAASAAKIIERYASRWSIEVCIEDAKQTGSVGQARNRVRHATKRTVPFALIVNTLAIIWYATVGYHPDDVDQRRELAPWYREKTQPSVLDMLTKLRRVIIASYLRTVAPEPPTDQETPSCAWPGRTSRHS